MLAIIPLICGLLVAIAPTNGADIEERDLAARALKTVTSTRRVTISKEKTAYATSTKTVRTTTRETFYPDTVLGATKATTTQPITILTASFVSSIPSQKFAARAEKTTTVVKKTTTTTTKYIGTTTQTRVLTTTRAKTTFIPGGVFTSTQFGTSLVPVATSAVKILREPYVACPSYGEPPRYFYGARQEGDYKLSCQSGAGDDSAGRTCVTDTRTGAVITNESDGDCKPALAAKLDDGSGNVCIDISACAGVTPPGFKWNRANSRRLFLESPDGEYPAYVTCNYQSSQTNESKTCYYDGVNGDGNPFNPTIDCSIRNGCIDVTSGPNCPPNLGPKPLKTYCLALEG